MEARELSTSFSVSPQISPDFVAQIAAQGFRAILCNRPDHEEYAQPTAQSIKLAADEAGLEFAFLPIYPSGVEDRDIAAFDAAIAALPGPVFAYCRSGTRCSIVWALWQARKGDVEDIIA